MASAAAPAAGAATTTATGAVSETPKWEKIILLTGGAGFIASHVVIRLVKNYPTYKIINFDKLDYCSSLKNIECISKYPNYEFVHGSITSPDLVNYVMAKSNVDTVLHFAAQTHVDNSFGNSFTFTENNILGTHVLLEAAKANSIKLFVHVSTDEVYGEGSDGSAHTEQSKLEPTNPYSATKAGAEYLVKAYARSFNLPVIITRGNNVYGPHQYPEKIIPKFINLMFRGLPLTLHGDGLNTRNFLYVEDVAAAFDIVLHKGTIGEVYNIGGGPEMPNVEVARKLLKIFKRDDQEDEFIKYVVDRPFNDLRYVLNSDKLRALGWKEEMDFEKGLTKTVEWYRENHGNWGDIDSALVAHPRRGHTVKEIQGSADPEADSNLQDIMAKPAPPSPSMKPATPSGAGAGAGAL